MLLRAEVKQRPNIFPRDAHQQVAEPERPEPGLPVESAWLNIANLRNTQFGLGNLIVSRWLDHSSSRRYAQTTTPADHHVLAVAMRRTRVRIDSDRRELFKGIMATGTVFLTKPHRTLTAEFDAPCDFVHFYLPLWIVESDGFKARFTEVGSRIRRDPLAAQLVRSLTDAPHACESRYAESIARTLLHRLEVHKVPPRSVCTLPIWRLKRVNSFLEANLANSISLKDMAEAAGLSRSYFAAQFRATTGYRPHDYLVEQRIEHAKALLTNGKTPLVEVGLSVGFQTQAHFSTVFKRVTGRTPGNWRLAKLNRT